MFRTEWKITFKNYFLFFFVVLLLMAGENLSIFAGENNSPVSPAVKMSSDKRFIDHGDKTITDTKTGLMWMKDDSFLHTGHWKSWYQAFEYVEQLNEEGFANYRDWEVPTVEELKTLYESEKVNSSQVGSEMKIHIDPIFSEEGSGSSWSTQSNGEFQAFGVIFNDGKRFSQPKKSKARKAVRAIRRPSH